MLPNGRPGFCFCFPGNSTLEPVKVVLDNDNDCDTHVSTTDNNTDAWRGTATTRQSKSESMKPRSQQHDRIQTYAPRKKENAIVVTKK